MDMVQSRLDFVTQTYGLTETICADGSDTDLTTVAELTDNEFCDVVIDATGSDRRHEPLA